MDIKKWVIIGVIFLMGGVAWFWNDVHRNAEKSSQGNSLETSLMLSDLQGNKVPVIPNGKVTIINFWATWCPGCREEMPELHQFVANKSDQIVFYAINLQESPEKIKDFMDRYQYQIPVLLDRDGSIGRKFKVTVIPTTIVVDKNGTIKYRHAGSITAADLKLAIQNL